LNKFLFSDISDDVPQRIVHDRPSCCSILDFKVLTTLQLDNKYCCLMFDAMSIKKQVFWDEKMEKLIGNCDVENALEIEGTNTATTEVIIFMFVSLNGRLKLPVRFILQNKETATTQAQIEKTV